MFFVIPSALGSAGLELSGDKACYLRAVTYSRAVT